MRVGIYKRANLLKKKVLKPVYKNKFQK